MLEPTASVASAVAGAALAADDSLEACFAAFVALLRLEACCAPPDSPRPDCFVAEDREDFVRTGDSPLRVATFRVEGCLSGGRPLGDGRGPPCGGAPSSPGAVVAAAVKVPSSGAFRTRLPCAFFAATFSARRALRWAKLANLSKPAGSRTGRERGGSEGGGFLTRHHAPRTVVVPMFAARAAASLCRSVDVTVSESPAPPGGGHDAQSRWAARTQASGGPGAKTEGTFFATAFRVEQIAEVGTAVDA